MNDSKNDISGDGRLAVLLLLMFALLLFDLTARHHWFFLDGNDDRISEKKLTFLPPDKLVIKNYSDAGRERHKPVPAVYTPFFFELIPINSANKDILMTVNGIGPALAESIIEYRSQFGPFKTSLDLQNLKGIGPKRAARFTTVFTFAEAP